MYDDVRLTATSATTATVLTDSALHIGESDTKAGATTTIVSINRVYGQDPEWVHKKFSLEAKRYDD
jgi:hypothetical protein